MKKFLISIFLAVLLSLTFTLVACDNGDPNDDGDNAYTVNFVCDENVSVYVYETQDMSAEGKEATTAYSRDSETGALLKDGNGQVNFKLVFEDGLELADIEITGDYKNLKGYTYDENSFRITKISSDLTVNVTTQDAGTAWGYEITFVINDDAHAQLTVYKTQSTSYGIVAAGEKVYSRDGDLGTLLNNGDGQVNFRIVVADGYEAEITITPGENEGYKNKKQDPEGEGDNNLYRITKIKANLTVTITVTAVA